MCFRAVLDMILFAFCKETVAFILMIFSMHVSKGYKLLGIVIKDLFKKILDAQINVLVGTIFLVASWCCTEFVPTCTLHSTPARLAFVSINLYINYNL